VKDLTSDIEQLQLVCEQEDSSDSDLADLGHKLAARGKMKKEIMKLEEAKQVNVEVTTVKTTNTLVLPAGSLVTLPAFGSVGQGQVRTKLTWVPSVHEVEVEMEVKQEQRQEQQDIDLAPVLEEQQRKKKREEERRRKELQICKYCNQPVGDKIGKGQCPSRETYHPKKWRIHSNGTTWYPCCDNHDVNSPGCTYFPHEN